MTNYVHAMSESDSHRGLKVGVSSSIAILIGVLAFMGANDREETWRNIVSFFSWITIPTRLKTLSPLSIILWSCIISATALITFFVHVRQKPAKSRKIVFEDLGAIATDHPRKEMKRHNLGGKRDPRTGEWMRRRR